MLVQLILQRHNDLEKSPFCPLKAREKDNFCIHMGRDLLSWPSWPGYRQIRLEKSLLKRQQECPNALIGWRTYVDTPHSPGKLCQSLLGLLPSPVPAEADSCSCTSLSVWVSAFCSWGAKVWVPCEVTEVGGFRGCRPMAFIRPMSLSVLHVALLVLKREKHK